LNYQTIIPLVLALPIGWAAAAVRDRVKGVGMEKVKPQFRPEAADPVIQSINALAAERQRQHENNMARLDAMADALRALNDRLDAQEANNG
jgi:hypothetical protein